MRGITLRGLALATLFVSAACGVQPAGPEAFTVVVIPDSQNAIRDVPEVWAEQLAWIRDEAEALDVRFVIHVGDIVARNRVEEWERALAGLLQIEGRVPYSVLPGNHDMARVDGVLTRDTGRYNDAFPRARLATLEHFRGSWGDSSDNTFHEFRAGGVDWLVVALEFGPRAGAVEWANEVVAAHPHHQVIVATHTYLYSDESLHGPTHLLNPHRNGIADEPGGVHDGVELWHALVKRHHNIRFVVSGHVLDDGVGYLRSVGDRGNSVHQLVSNYQMLPEGGGGYLRLMRFDPAAGEVEVTTYSPWLDAYLTDGQNEFSFRWDPTTPGVE